MEQKLKRKPKNSPNLKLRQCKRCDDLFWGFKFSRICPGCTKLPKRKKN